MTKSRPRSQPVSAATIVAALIDADRLTDEAIAERYGVARKTISDWRKRANDDPEIGKMLDAARRKALCAWRDEAAQTYVAIARAIRRKAEEGEPIGFDLIAAAKTYGSANLQAGALLGDDGRPEDDK